jgi:hypothetical protein
MKFLKLFLVVLVLLPVFLFSQEQADETGPEPFKGKIPFFAIRANGCVPNPVFNETFRRSFVGIYEGSLHFDFTLYKSLYIGVGAKNGLFSVSNKVQQIKTKMQINSAFVKLGISKYHNAKINTHFAVSGGYTWAKFTGIVCLKGQNPNPTFQTPFVETELSINFFAEENFSIGPVFSYVYQSHVFDPAQICLGDWTNLGNMEYSKPTGIFNLGFCVYVGFPKKEDKKKRK